MKSEGYRGLYTALATPMERGGALDSEGCRKLCEYQIENGVDGLVPVGTTGESATLNHEEHRRVIEISVGVSGGQVKVLAGTGSNSTAEAIDLSLHAAKVGADGLLVVTPYYNKPDQGGLYEHYSAIASSVELPIVIYNIPSRSAVDMNIETIASLVRDHENIIGVKDATQDLGRPLRTRMAIGKEFAQFSGEDISVGAFLAQGGHGVISVTSNLAPKLYSELIESWDSADMDRHGEIRDSLAELHDACFMVPSPSAPKYGLSLLGICGSYVRLPMRELSEENKKKMRGVMERVGLI